MPNKENNNNILWLLIAGILGIAGFAIFGNKPNTTTDTASNFTSQPQTKKFGCGCNKGN